MNIVKKIFVAAMCAGVVMLSCAKKETAATDGEGFLDSRDGQRYRVVTIGAHIWMAQNLNFETQGSKCYDDDPKNCEKFGRLYSWDDARTACPAGWRLANHDDWMALIDAAGGWRTAATILKSKTGWNDNGNGTDDLGFSALPGGFYYDTFNNVGKDGNWWTGTEFDATNPQHRSMLEHDMEANTTNALYRNINYQNNFVNTLFDGKTIMYSVRCVQDVGEQGETETQGESESEFAQFIPSGYIILSEATGDLNRDGIDDRVFLVVSRNDESTRDGIVITFCFEPQGCEVVFTNPKLFAQCEGGETELCNVKIERNNLKLARESDESRKIWTFRLSANGFELIGYDEEFFGGDGFVTRTISVNHLTTRKLTKTMTNAEDFYSDNFRARYNEEWENVVVENLFVLSEETTDLINITGYRAAPVSITTGGHTFSAVTIANTMWMVHNLNIDVEGARCYNDVLINCISENQNCGRMYQWETAYNLCANLGDGWRLPNDADWTELIEIGGLNDPNIFGFEIEFCGYNIGGHFGQINDESRWWSATELTGSTARAVWRVRRNGIKEMETRTKSDYLSVRCVKDLYND